MLAELTMEKAASFLHFDWYTILLAIAYKVQLRKVWNVVGKAAIFLTRSVS